MYLTLAVLTLALVSTTATPSHAECLACAVSCGVRIRLTSGKHEEGYLSWNNASIEDLIFRYGLDDHPTAARLIEQYPQLDSSDGCHGWMELMNTFIPTNLPMDHESDASGELRIFRTLVRVKHSPDRFVAIEGESISVPQSDVVEISSSVTHHLSVDITGIGTVSRQDANLLRDRNPRFVVENQADVSAEVYAVYDKRLSVTEVLEHIVHDQDARGTTLLVNDVKIVEAGVPLATVPDTPGVQPWRADCQRFLEKYDAGRRARCAEEYAQTQRELDQLANDDPRRLDIYRRRQIIPISCWFRDPVVPGTWQSLGTPQQLRKRGVIVYSYAWD